ncbi:hypothetical protein ACEV60_22645 [Enterobacter ludwigii]|uniref:hypothetical protein n=1 Tax=Enterobacter TaxID=547 RepID=UPI003BEEE6A5
MISLPAGTKIWLVADVTDISFIGCCPNREMYILQHRCRSRFNAGGKRKQKKNTVIKGRPTIKAERPVFYLVIVMI